HTLQTVRSPTGSKSGARSPRPEMCLTRVEFFQPFLLGNHGHSEQRRGIPWHCLPHHRGLLRLRFALLRMTGSANPAAAEDNVPVVNDGSLSGRHGTLRIVQSHMGAIILEWRDRRNRPGMIVADFDNSFERTAIGARGYSVVARVAAPGSRMPV